MIETIPVYLKGTDKVVQAEPAPANQVVHTRHSTDQAIASGQCQGEC